MIDRVFAWAEAKHVSPSDVHSYTEELSASGAIGDMLTARGRDLVHRLFECVDSLVRAARVAEEFREMPFDDMARAYSAAFESAGNRTDQQRMYEAAQFDADLLWAAVEQGEIGEDAVSEAFFGRLWPNQSGGPEREIEQGSIDLLVEVPDDVADNDIIAALVELASRADAVDRAYGGHGLRIETLEAFGEVPVPVEAVQ